MHIIFGWKDPVAKPAPRLRKKGDIYYSESNYNLMLEGDGWPSLGDLILALSGGKPCECPQHIEEPEHGSVWVREDDFRSCYDCQQSTKVPCALIQDPSRRPPPDASPREVAKAVLWPWDSYAGLHVCPIVNRLLRMTDTPAESRFYEMYLRYALRPIANEMVLSHAFSPEFVMSLRERGYRSNIEVGASTWFHVVWSDLLMKNLDYPALIPQVVLNFVPTSDLPEDHPDKRFFESNEGRVDFVFFDENGKHIVQIDGPYHHRTDAEYTRVLRRDRTMRRQGWHVHRFSNKEVMEAEHFGSFAWEMFQ